MPIRFSSKTLVLLAFFVVLLGCRGNSSSDLGAPSGTGHAFFLKNTGGDVSVTDLYGTRIYSQTTVSDGTDGLGASQWKVSTQEPKPEELVVIKISGGKDISSKSLSVSEDAEMFAIASVEDVRKGINVSPLSDLIWRISSAYVQRSERSDSGNYLNYLAGLFLKGDLNGDGGVTYRDVLDFNPNDPQHTASLAFEFSTVCCNSQSYVNQVLLGVSTEDLDTEIKNLFGGHVSLAQDETISSHAGITVVGFGAGYVLDENGETVYEPAEIKTRFHVSKSRANSYYLTAYPDADSRILGWNGCDQVSADGTRCELDSFVHDRVVEINFGYNEVAIAADYVGLGEGLTGAITQDKITVDLPSDVTIKNRLINLSPGNKVSLVVNDKPLLVSVQDVINHADSVELGYVQAKLSDVIEKGTGTFNQVFTADDIKSITYPTNPASQSIKLQPHKLLVQPSSDPAVISLAIEPAASGGPPMFQDSKLWDVDGEALELSGSLNVKFELGLNASYEFGDGLRFLKVSPSISTDANISILSSGSLKTKVDASGNDMFRRHLGRLEFGRKVFLIGFVPVYLEPYVDVYLGANGEVSGQMEFKSYMKSSVFAHMYYSKEAGVEYSSGYNSDWSPGEPFIENQARFRMYAGAQPTVQIYDLMGPAIDIQGYSEMRSSYDLTSGCSESLVYGIYAGLESVLKWEAEGGNKFFEVVGFKPADLRVSLGMKEGKIFENKINMCGPAPAAMLVNGNGISEIIEEGSSEDITRSISIENVGEQTLTWRADYQADSHLTVYPDGGELMPGEIQTLSMTFNNLGSREIREYRNVVQFSQVGNASLETAVPFRRVDVSVVPKKISAPEIVEAFRRSDDPTTADIEWSVDQADEPFIQRFDAYLTNDPVLAQQKENNHENPAWEKLAEFGGTQRAATVSGLADDRIFLSIQAIGTKGQVVQAKTFELKERADHGLVARTASGATFLTYDGGWSAEGVAHSAFGNIDWKGHYIGNTPTKILSWNGPSSRYFGDTGFSSEIYKGGKLFAVAPGSVHGAAILVDGVGSEWLVAMVNGTYTDTLFARPNTPSNSPGLYDPVTNPEGWREILSRPQEGQVSGGWFFSPAGTEARSLRYVDKKIVTNGQEFDVVVGVINELTISIQSGMPGVQNANFRTYTPENTINSAVLAVDYNQSGSVELRRSAANWLEVGGISIIPNSELKLWCFEGEEGFCPSLAHVTSVGNEGIHAGDYALEVNGSRLVNVYYVDLRAELYAYSVGLADDTSGWTRGNYRIRLKGELVASSEIVEARGWAPSFVHYSFDDYSRVDAFTYTDVNSFWLKGAMPPPEGSWAVGPNKGLIISQEDGSGGERTFNYINNGGDLDMLLGVYAGDGLIEVGVK